MHLIPINFTQITVLYEMQPFMSYCDSQIIDSIDSAKFDKINQMWNPYVFSIPYNHAIPNNDAYEHKQSNLNARNQNISVKPLPPISNKMFQVTYKLNGHVKRIRKKDISQLSLQVQNQIQQYLLTIIKDKKPFHQLHHGQLVSNRNRKNSHSAASVFNINIKPINVWDSNCIELQTRPTQNHIGQKKDSKQSNIDSLNDFQSLALLKQQIKLFQTPKDIETFIETQKNVATNVQDELTQLLFNTLTISLELIRQDQMNYVPNVDQLLHQQMNRWHEQDFIMIKENLQKIQDKCFETLNKIKDERRKLQLCAICLNKKSNTIILPCMHLGTCQQCSQMVQKCPFCKVKIQGKKLVYK